MKLRGRYNTDEQLKEFADALLEFAAGFTIKVSSRGWAYLLEGERLINKDEFDKVANLINTCRKKGLIPIDFVAEESARMFEGVVEPDSRTVHHRFRNFLEWSLRSHEDFNVNWWRGEEYYIQMVVEKVDLIALFKPVCAKYKIPIANSKGWSSMLQRAEYARRFKEAQDQGLKCVLLYCGDHDPDGLRISEFLRKNLEDLNDVYWDDGEDGYDPQDLIIDRFGLDFEFIKKYGLTWIDNLITGSGGAIAKLDENGKIVPGKTKGGKIHPNFKMDYAQRYLKEVGVRKCEANAIIVIPKAAEKLVEDSIAKYLGKDAYNRFSHKQDDVKTEFNSFVDSEEIQYKIQDIIDISTKYEEDNE
jgi:hypothetical protein